MEQEHDDRADELEQEADRLEQAGDDVKDDVDETRSDWETRKSDASIPGALDADSTGPDELVEDQDTE